MPKIHGFHLLCFFSTIINYLIKTIVNTIKQQVHNFHSININLMIVASWTYIFSLQGVPIVIQYCRWCTSNKIIMPLFFSAISHFLLKPLNFLRLHLCIQMQKNPLFICLIIFSYFSKVSFNLQLSLALVRLYKRNILLQM